MSHVPGQCERTKAARTRQDDPGIGSKSRGGCGQESGREVTLTRCRCCWALDLRAFRVCLYLNIPVRRFGGRRMWSRVEVARKQIRRPGGGAKKGVEMA